LPGDQLQKLHHGTFHVHSLHGHKLHAVLQKGKLSRLYMTSRAGRTFHPTRKNTPAQTAAATELRNAAPVSQDGAQAGFGGGMAAYVFLIPTNGGTLQITIVFPANFS
jgi:hypothetical protein